MSEERPLILTEEPRPGVAEIGTETAIMVGMKDGRLEVLSFRPSSLDKLKTVARANAHAFDDIVILSGKIEYRIWRKDNM